MPFPRFQENSAIPMLSLDAPASSIVVLPICVVWSGPAFAVGGMLSGTFVHMLLSIILYSIDPWVSRLPWSSAYDQNCCVSMPVVVSQ